MLFPKEIFKILLKQSQSLREFSFKAWLVASVCSLSIYLLVSLEYIIKYKMSDITKEQQKLCKALCQSLVTHKNRWLQNCQLNTRQIGLDSEFVSYRSYLRILGIPKASVNINKLDVIPGRRKYNLFHWNYLTNLNLDDHPLIASAARDELVKIHSYNVQKANTSTLPTISYLSIENGSNAHNRNNDLSDNITLNQNTTQESIYTKSTPYTSPTISPSLATLTSVTKDASNRMISNGCHHSCRLPQSITTTPLIQSKPLKSMQKDVSQQIIINQQNQNIHNNQNNKDINNAFNENDQPKLIEDATYPPFPSSISTSSNYALDSSPPTMLFSPPESLTSLSCDSCVNVNDQIIPQIRISSASKTPYKSPRLFHSNDDETSKSMQQLQIKPSPQNNNSDKDNIDTFTAIINNSKPSSCESPSIIDSTSSSNNSPIYLQNDIDLQQPQQTKQSHQLIQLKKTDNMIQLNNNTTNESKIQYHPICPTGFVPDITNAEVCS